MYLTVCLPYYNLDTNQTSESLVFPQLKPNEEDTFDHEIHKIPDELRMEMRELNSNEVDDELFVSKVQHIP